MFLSTIIYFTTLYTTYYKIELSETSPYYIFPWSKEPIISHSEHSFLTTHIIFALILMTASWIRIVMSFFYPKNTLFKKLTEVLNCCFSVIVILGCQNLGSLHWEVAVLINLVMIFLLKILQDNHYHLYFYFLSTPAIFEIYLLLSQFITCFFYSLIPYSELKCSFIPLHK